MKFWADNASFPFKSHDLWFLTEDMRWGVLPQSTNKMALVNKVNRADIWRASAQALGAPAPASDSRGVEKFFDGKVFDPANPAAAPAGPAPFHRERRRQLPTARRPL